MLSTQAIQVIEFLLETATEGQWPSIVSAARDAGYTNDDLVNVADEIAISLDHSALWGPEDLD